MEILIGICIAVFVIGIFLMALPIPPTKQLQEIDKSNGYVEKRMLRNGVESEFIKNN